MSLEIYLSIVAQYAEDYDRPAAIRSYQAYCKAFSALDKASMQLHIQRMLPQKDMVSILSILRNYGAASDYNVGKAVKWLQQNGEAWEETLCGVYLTAHAAKILQSFLENVIPVNPEFERFCNSIPVVPTQAMYADFCRKYGKQLIQTRYHPYFADRWFWMGEMEELHRLIRKWHMAYSMHIPSDLEGYVSVIEGAATLEIKSLKLLEWLWAHEDHYVCHKGCCLINANTIDALRNQWENVQPIMALVKQKIDQLPVKARAGAKASVISWLEENNHDWILPNGTFPQQTDGVLYTLKPLAANHALDKLIHAYPAIPINRLVAVTHLQTKDLKKKATDGIIEAVRDDTGNWYISINEYRRITVIQEQYIPLDDIVYTCINGSDSKFDIGVHYIRDSLISYCNEYDWWGLNYAYCNELPIDGKKFGIVIARADFDQVVDCISLWLQGYGQTYAKKFCLITEKYSQKFPDTIASLLEYEKNAHSADKALVDMAHLLCLSLQKDLKKRNDAEIEQSLIAPFIQTASLASCDLLGDFLYSCGYVKKQFAFSRGGKRTDISAYSAKDFAIMMAYIVNDDVIKESELIPKAIENKKYADLWLYIALHMFASWRSTDYIRMIAPYLPYGPREMLKKIKDGKLLPEEARAVAECFIATNRLALSVPNKTKGTTGVPRLYFFCPQSCMESFGIILAISAAHHQLNPAASTYVNPEMRWTVIKQFFGSEFLTACGNRSFSGRRANKSLLQCIEYMGREGEQLSPTIAYYLASIVRSHKLTYGKLSETTDIYLRDAAFAKMTPEYIVYQMWERGVCSFVTDTMLKICYGDQYTGLSVPQQTEVITSIGITPAQTADILMRIQCAEDHACKVVKSVCQSRDSMEYALKQIAFGHGIGKEPDGYCLCKAAGVDCRYKDRLSCLGCRYEIRTKALLLRYAVVHYKLLESYKNETEAEKMRHMHLCKTVTCPAMQEILLHLDRHTANAELKLYKNLVQEAMAYGVTSGCTL